MSNNSIKILLIFYFLLLVSSCGIPVNILKLELPIVYTSNIDGEFNFKAQNNESYFIGYNIYYQTSNDDILHIAQIYYINDNNEEILVDNIDPLLRINNPQTFFNEAKLFTVFYNKIQYTKNNLNTVPLNFVVLDEDGKDFYSNYHGFKITFIIEPYGLDQNGTQIPIPQSTENRITITIP